MHMYVFALKVKSIDKIMLRLFWSYHSVISPIEMFRNEILFLTIDRFFYFRILLYITYYLINYLLYNENTSIYKNLD